MSRVLPILFNMEMVRSILDGRKSCTRRIIKPQSQGYFEVSEEPLYIYDTDGKQGKITPPYQPGDILYVRETWKQAPNGYYYYEDWQRSDIADITKWKPSIHMPKEAARIWLKVTDVRAERLQEITAESALLEGTDKYIHLNGKFDKNAILTSFMGIWNSTIKKSDFDRYGWDTNPYVWVIEFERCEKPKEEKGNDSGDSK